MKNYNSKKVLAAVIFLAAELAVLFGSGAKKAQAKDPLQPSIASKVLRFHVVADSDSETDQKLKLKVRDRVGKYIESKLNNSKSLAESEAIIGDLLSDIEELAGRELRENGCQKPVKAYLSDVDFPEKTYGGYRFPAGRYRALEVVIGSGRGHNWWCVLYPNLCFRGSMYEVIGDQAKEELREVLSPEEYQDLLDSGNYHVRWKLWETLENLLPN